MISAGGDRAGVVPGGTARERWAPLSVLQGPVLRDTAHAQLVLPGGQGDLCPPTTPCCRCQLCGEFGAGPRLVIHSNVHLRHPCRWRPGHPDDVSLTHWHPRSINRRVDPGQWASPDRAAGPAAWEILCMVCSMMSSARCCPRGSGAVVVGIGSTADKRARKSSSDSVIGMPAFPSAPTDVRLPDDPFPSRGDPEADPLPGAGGCSPHSG